MITALLCGSSEEKVSSENFQEERHDPANCTQKIYGNSSTQHNFSNEKNTQTLKCKFN